MWPLYHKHIVFLWIGYGMSNDINDTLSVCDNEIFKIFELSAKRCALYLIVFILWPISYESAYPLFAFDCPTKWYFFLFLVLIWQNKRPDMLALFGHFLLLIWHIACTHLMQNVRCWLSPPPPSPVFLQINKSIIMFILKYWIRQKCFSLFTKCS